MNGPKIPTLAKPARMGHPADEYYVTALSIVTFVGRGFSRDVQELDKKGFSP